MKFLSFLFGRRKKSVAPRIEPSVAPVGVTIASLDPESEPASSAADFAAPATSWVEPAPAPLNPLPSPSSTVSQPAPWEQPSGSVLGGQARVQGVKEWPMGVAGTVHNQEALIAACGPYKWSNRNGVYQTIDAMIELEPTNPRDPNAVVVKIEGRPVGYLYRDQAARVGQQMRDEGLDAAACGAQVSGGWRVNQHEGGVHYYEVRLKIPEKGWIDFGIGSTRPKPVRTSSTTDRWVPAETGPLKGHRIALMGSQSAGHIEKQLAAAGAKIMADVGKSTTLLAVIGNEPFDYWIRNRPKYRKAEELIAKGVPLRIVSLDEVRKMIAAG